MNTLSLGRFKARHDLYKPRIRAEASTTAVGIWPDALKVMN
jgi:hypothetical protein